MFSGVLILTITFSLDNWIKYWKLRKENKILFKELVKLEMKIERFRKDLIK